MGIPKIVVGVVLLLFGRKLYWLFVGVVGFLVGVALGEQIPTQSATGATLVALGVGLVGVLVAVLLQRLAFSLAGGYIGYSLGHIAAMAADVSDERFLVIVGAVVGAVVAALLMDTAIVFLASAVGASAVVTGLELNSPLNMVAFVALCVAGILFQRRGEAQSRRQR